MADIKERMHVSSSSSSSSSSSVSTMQMQIDGELWIVAEERAQEILNVIQPVYVSDRSRNEIINYLQTLVKGRLGLEVFNFGSVPLKTYLPDGDIDLTVLTPKDKEEDLAKAIRCTLEAEVGKSDFHVTDVQYIQAQVKVIKCRIRKIAVDISFNQMAGLSAFCFLEQVDQIFGRDHLFKRSIILIKAWCYYESRTLGANAGLISTYALAVLVLHIINISYSSLSGPLAVLFKFLDYYASFDWGNNCVTVFGPVLISSLPDMTEIEHREVVLNEKFVRECMEFYSFSTKAVEANGHIFPVRHFNIVDPLKHNNNLGRSVTQGNVQRLKHAFTLGARKLKDVLKLRGETVGWKLKKFFANSLERNGKGRRLDVEEPVTAFGTGRSELSELRGDFEGCFESLVYGKWFHGETQLLIPQGHDTSSWDIVNGQKKGFYWRSVNGASSLQNMKRSRGTDTYIPQMR
ncbi:NTP_transf_2 domain-containing protein [Hirschfeldia incana]|nr:NTP_transf_2 domain-containing protein [Hirschfeldia incana]